MKKERKKVKDTSGEVEKRITKLIRKK